VNESVFKSDFPLSTTPIFLDSYSIDFLQGDALESRIRNILNDPTDENRLAALHEVYRLDQSAAVHLLHEVLLRETDGDLIQEASIVLSDIAGEYSVSMVTTALSDADVAVRSQSIEALGLLGIYGYSQLGQVLLADPDLSLRLRALELLAADGGIAAMSLLQGVVDDASPEISMAAKQALSLHQSAQSGSAMEYVSETLYLLNDEIRFDAENPVFGLTLDNSPDERADALGNLQYIDEEDALRTLKVVLQQDKDLSVRKKVLFVLDRIGGQSAFSVISTALGDESSVLRLAALESLWWNGAPDRFAIAGQVIFSDPDPIVRLEAIRLLDSASDPAASSLLMAARQDSDEQVSQYADQLLRQ
jgi:HEAT repeat protein